MNADERGEDLLSLSRKPPFYGPALFSGPGFRGQHAHGPIILPIAHASLTLEDAGRAAALPGTPPAIAFQLP